MVYYVFEMQSNETGAGLVTAYTDINDAREKYYEILKYASKSAVRKHGAVILDEDGFIVEPVKVINHNAPIESASE